MFHGAPVDDSPPCQRSLVREEITNKKARFVKKRISKKSRKVLLVFLSSLDDFEFIWLPLYYMLQMFKIATHHFFFSKVPIIFFLKQDFASLLDKKFAQCPPIKVLYNFGMECIMESKKETAKVGPIEWLYKVYG